MPGGRRRGLSAEALEPGEGLEITGELDRQAAEVLRLELRRLARRYGLEITDFRVERLDGEAGEAGSR